MQQLQPIRAIAGEPHVTARGEHGGEQQCGHGRDAACAPAQPRLGEPALERRGNDEQAEGERHHRCAAERPERAVDVRRNDGETLQRTGDATRGEPQQRVHEWPAMQVKGGRPEARDEPRGTRRRQQGAFPAGRAPRPCEQPAAEQYPAGQQVVPRRGRRCELGDEPKREPGHHQPGRPRGGQSRSHDSAAHRLTERGYVAAGIPVPGDADDVVGGCGSAARRSGPRPWGDRWRLVGSRG